MIVKLCKGKFEALLHNALHPLSLLLDKAQWCHRSLVNRKLGLSAVQRYDTSPRLQQPPGGLRDLFFCERKIPNLFTEENGFIVVPDCVAAIVLHAVTRSDI